MTTLPEYWWVPVLAFVIWIVLTEVRLLHLQEMLDSQVAREHQKVAQHDAQRRRRGES